MRPTGVTVLSILAGILGLLVLLVGIVAVGASAFIADLIESYASTVVLPVGVTATFLAGILAIIGTVVIIIGVLHILVAYGMWVGAGWAWWLTIILAILGVIGGLLTLPGGIITLIIYAVIIWYFWQPYVKAYFGQARAPAPPPTPPPV
jgi:hypothetical protein